MTEQVLQLWKGIPNAPGDTNSAELVSPLEALNLMAGETGFAVSDWTTNYAPFKGGGLYSESQITDGKTLLSAAYDVVTEVITLQVAVQNMETRIQMLEQLLRFGRAAVDYHMGVSTLPVSLVWHAPGGKGAQYALVNKIEFANRGNIQNAPAVWTLVITIERFPKWHGLPINANPIEWHFYKQELVPGVGYDYTDMDLTAGTDHFGYQACYNNNSWDPADYVTAVRQNWIDIEAADIPGDAPALTMIVLETIYNGGLGSRVINWHIAQSLQPLSYKDRSGAVDFAPIASLNAGDAILSGVGVKAAGFGIFSNGSAVNDFYASFPFAAAAFAVTNVISWPDSNFYITSLAALSGEYAFFLRNRQTTGAAGDLKINLRLAEVENTSGADSVITLPQVNAFVDPNNIGMTYLGRARIPFSDKRVGSPDGRGLQVPDNTGITNLSVHIQVQKISTATRQWDVTDLIMLPVDVAYCKLAVEHNSGGGAEDRFTILDNTGYLSGQIELPTARYVTDSTGYKNTGRIVEVQGAAIYLYPGYKNRLYFIEELQGNVTPVDAAPPVAQFNVRLNIIPRWIGIRSE